MYKYKVLFLLLMITVMATCAYSQQSPEGQKIEEASGTLLKVNSQERIIYLNSFGNQMAFSVLKDAVISRETVPATLENVRAGDSASVRYYVSSGAVNVAVSINDTKPVVIITQ